MVGFRVGFEHLVFLDQAREGVGGNLPARQEALLDAQAVEGGALGRFAVQFGPDGAHRFQQHLGLQLAGFPFVGAGFVFHDGDAVFLITAVPGLDGSPGEAAGMPVLVGEVHLADGLNARADRVAGSHVDGTQDAHF